MINHIHIINGPNLNLLGKREPEIYGSISFEEYIETLILKYPGVELIYFQSNNEGKIIDYLHQHGFAGNTGMILNGGGLSHTSVSLRDAVSAIEVPVIEVHISNIYEREIFRHLSFLTDVSVTHFIGLGLKGYDQAIEYFINKMETHSSPG
ncbi:MAG TPA: type II 3-dehydroquinate dehydratase [Saprospiraceae bacterium]|nr:type II 3-dehydroquinate dehydratase [Saprospiraceae bacterium]